MTEAGIVNGLVTSLIKTLGSVVVEEMVLIHGVREELEKLLRTFRTIQAVLLDAEEKSNHNNGVKVWLEELKDATYNIDDILDSFSYESMSRNVMTEGKMAKKVRIFLSKHNQIAFRLIMAHKIKNLSERLDHIANERMKFHLKETVDNISETWGRETHSFVPEDDVIGRDEEKEEVVRCLLEINEQQNVSVDAIVGLGGMGKTTLAQSVFNHERVKDGFQLRLWVCISQRFDLKAILEKIVESATDQRASVQELDSLQKKLRTQIDGKKYLLVIDDLWNEDREKWDGLKRLLMGGAKGSKILITTRAEKVAKVSQATSLHILKGLSESNSWLLFKKMAFEDREEPKSPNMIQIGKEIAKECFGSPLVIRTIGRLLNSKMSEAEWLSFKKKDLETITREENRITEVLKLSYNHLSPHLKPCFAYCALFPEDHWFEKDKLIKLWVAEGFVQSRGENKCLEDVGDEYFMELAWRSIFQDVERNQRGDIVRCKMHDLMHDLARLVAGIECYTTNSDIENVNGRTRRISRNCYRENWSLLSTPLLKPYKLRTLLSPNGYSWERDESELNALISSLKSLRVLDLNKLSMKQVPFSIGMLKHLRYLDLSHNGEIQLLPSSITKLHNLETLKISFCSFLKELPRDIGNLTNLKHLYLNQDRSIQRLPTSVTMLKFLQTLILSSTQLKELPENIGNMLDLRILHLEHNYKVELLPNSIAKLKKLQSLNLKGCAYLRELPSDFSNLVDLMHLDLEGCYALRGMPRGLNKLTDLRKLNLFVVGASVSSEDGGLWQLNTLTNITGRLLIRGLHHLREDASHANTVNLKDVHGVRDLSLEWTEAGYNPTGIDPDFAVLEKLHPNKNVKNLSIYGYGGVRLSSWVSSLSNMIQLSLKNCERLLNVPRLDRLPKLQKLELCNISRIEYMDNNETGDGFGSSVFFPSLWSLTLQKMNKLKGWWNPKELSPKDPGQSFFLPSFHCLDTLFISGCPQLLSIPSPNSSLKTLILIDSNAELLKGEPIGSASLEDDTQQRKVLDGRDDLHSEGLQHLTSLQSLSIINCNDLIMVPGWIGNLASLQKLEIENCPNLTSFPNGIVNLSSLQKFKIETCPKLTPLLPNGIGSHSSLQELVIIDCPKLDWIGNFISIKKLIISNCPIPSSLPDGIVNLTSLHKLEVRCCPNLTSFPDGIGNLASLEELKIEKCPKLTLPLPNEIGSHSSLQKLEIRDCPKLDWIGNFISLQELRISNCRILTSFSDGISNLTSLQKLEIGSCYDLTSLPEGMGNLASLQNLVIKNCSEITSLGDGFRKLTSLQVLTIENCPKLDWHPENKRQLSAIRRLTRSGCGRRQEERRTQQNGENWSEIAPGEFIRISK